MNYKRAGFLRSARFCFRHRNRVPGPIAFAGLPGLILAERWPSRLVATAAEDRLNFRRAQFATRLFAAGPIRKKPRHSDAEAKLGFVVSRGVTRDESDGNGYPLSPQQRDFRNSIAVTFRTRNRDSYNWKPSSLKTVAI